MREHYPSLVVAYLVGVGGWWLASRLLPRVWPRGADEHFARPWRELGFALAGIVGVLAMGQLWGKGVRLPAQGTLAPVLESINQLLIFAPLLLVVILPRQSWTSAWLPRGHLGTRILVGVLLATVAVLAYSLVREGSAPPWTMVSRIWRYENLDEMVQVFLEDVAIAILFVRVAAVIGSRWATVLVACLFAAGHIPAIVSQVAGWQEVAGLVRDAGLGVAMIVVLQRSRDVVWFWCIHFCLDMTQFGRISGR